ncbi:MAG: NTP transferase domain-containing protein [Steroidobacteraceae bacterium]
MRRDKAALAYHGRTQLEHGWERLTAVAQHAFVSVRPDQVDDLVRRAYPQIVDERSDIGPLAGILAAQHAHPHAAWLVLACDLPFLDERTLARLVAARDGAALATAFRSSHDGLPEPLCAIYEPRSHEALLAHLASGSSCPRKFLIRWACRCSSCRMRARSTTSTRWTNTGTPCRPSTPPPPRRPARSACSTSPCCASRRGAARSGSRPGPARRASSTTSCAPATRSRSPRKRCASPSTAISATGRSRWRRAMSWCSSPGRRRPSARSRDRRPRAAHPPPWPASASVPAPCRSPRRRPSSHIRPGGGAARRLGAQPQRGPRRHAARVRGLNMLAVREGERIIEEAIARFGVQDARCVHRRRLAHDRRARGLGRCRRTPPRRGVPRLPLHHRRGQAPRPDLEEGTLRQRRLGLGELRALRRGAEFAARARHQHGHDHGHGHAHDDDHEHGHGHALTITITGTVSVATTRGRTRAQVPPQPDYSRQMALREVGVRGQARLRASCVAVIGAAASGSRCCSTWRVRASAAC